MAVGTLIGQAYFNVTADTSEAEKAITDSPSKIEGIASGKFNALGRNLSIALTAPIVAGLGLALKAALEEDQQMQVLANVIRNNVVGATDELIDANERWITGLQSSIGIADGDIRDLQQRFLAAGASVEEAQRLTTVAYDTAAATGKNATSIADGFVRALNGQTAGLSRLGVQVKKADGTMKTFDEIVEDLGVHTGTAADAMDNSAGRAQIMRLRMDDLQEDIGRVLIPVLDKLVSVGSKIVGWLSSLPQPALTVIVAIAGLAAAIGPVLLIIPKLVAGFQLVMTAFRALSALMMTNPWILLIAAVVALVIIIVTNWDTIVAFLKNVWEWITTTVGKVFGGIRDFFAGVWASITNAFRTAWETIKTAVKAALDFLLALFLNWTLPGLIIKHWETIKNTVRTLVTNIWDFIVNTFNKLVSFFTNLGPTLFNAGANMINSLWDGIKAVGKKVVDWVNDNVVQRIKNLWPFSPAKEGPFRGSGSPFNAGKNIMNQLAEGMRAAAPSVQLAAVGGLPSFDAPSGFSGGGGASFGNIEINLNFESEVTPDMARSAGREAAEAVLNQLANSQLVRRS